MSSRENERRQHEEHQIHTQNLGRPEDQDDTAPQTLKYVSEPEDIEAPIDALEWINSKSASTSNLEPEDVRSKEWVLEYFQLLARLEHPPEYGLKGPLRAWAYDDSEEYRKPLKPSDRLETEGFTEVGKEAKSRSKDGWGVETATKDTKESIVRGKESDSSGGILGKLR